MVAFAPRFDPYGDIGRALGGGIGQAVGTVGQQQYERGQMLQGLDTLKNLDPKTFSQMSYPQKLATFIEPFVGRPGGNMLIGNTLAPMLKYMESNIGVPGGGGVPGGIPDIPVGQDPKNSIPPDLSTRERALWEANQKFMQTQDKGETSLVPPEGIPQEQKPIIKTGQTRGSLPANAPGYVRRLSTAFPDIGAMTLRGNPQGLSFDQQQHLVNQMTLEGRDRASSIEEVKDLSNYLQEQSTIFQGLQNQASKNVQAKYEKSPLYPMMQRIAQNEVEKQVDAGNLEPNSVMNAARQRTKQIETAYNNAKMITGRPYFEWNLDEQKKRSGNVISPLVKEGEVQSAIELLMLDTIQEGDKEISGPDWGPVRATEIVQERLPGNNLKKVRDFSSNLPNISSSELSKSPFEATRAYNARKPKGMKELEDFIVEMGPQESLTLVRAYAADKGYEEDDFNIALDKAKNRREKPFSDYQDWEQSTLLSIPIRPSMKELLLGKRKVSDWLTGKK